MLLKKIVVVSLGIIFSITSLSNAQDRMQGFSDKMHRQQMRFHQKHLERTEQPRFRTQYLKKQEQKRQKAAQFAQEHGHKETSKSRQHKHYFSARGLFVSALVTVLLLNAIVPVGAQNIAPKSGSGYYSSSSYDCVVNPHRQECSASMVTTSFNGAGGRTSLGHDSVTTSGLAGVFCPISAPHCVQVNNNRATFKGTEKELDTIERTFGDFSKIREKLIPPTREAAKTQAHPKPKFDDFSEVLVSLGVPPKELENMQVTEFSDCTAAAKAIGLDSESFSALPICKLGEKHNNLVAINYQGQAHGGRSFNQRTADAFLETLKQDSLFFKFLTDTNRNVITYTDQYIFMNVGIFNEYFSQLPSTRIDQGQGLLAIELPLDAVLKRMVAAVSGEISLEQTSTPGKFGVDKITVNDHRTTVARQGTPPVVKIIFDRSGSMAGVRIAEVNRNVPILIDRLHKNLGPEDLLNVTLYALDDKIELSKTFLLGKDHPVPVWEDVEVRGGTDLTPIGNLLKIGDDESPHQTEVAFTDGEHVGPNVLDAQYYSQLKAAQASGKVAQPFLCKVGGLDDTFFKEMQKMFAGSYYHEDSVKGCIDRVIQAVQKIVQPKAPLILTIDGENKVVWLELGQTGIQKTNVAVRQGDVIVLGKYKAKIDVETTEQKRARLLKELEELGHAA